MRAGSAPSKYAFEYPTSVGHRPRPTCRHNDIAAVIHLGHIILLTTMGVDHGGGRTSPLQNLERGDCPPRFCQVAKF